MYDNQRCPKAKGKRRRGLRFVSRSYLTWSALVPDVAVCRLPGGGAQGKPTGKGRWGPCV